MKSALTALSFALAFAMIASLPAWAASTSKSKVSASGSSTIPDYGSAAGKAVRRFPCWRDDKNQLIVGHLWRAEIQPTPPENAKIYSCWGAMQNGKIEPATRNELWKPEDSKPQ